VFQFRYQKMTVSVNRAILTALILGVSCGPAAAFDLNKLMGANKSGGLFKSLGMPTGAGQQPNKPKGQRDYEWLSTFCSSSQYGSAVDTREYMYDSDNKTLTLLKTMVARDFDRSLEDTQILLNADLNLAGSIKWAQSLELYQSSFKGIKTPLLFEKFISEPSRRLERLGKIRSLGLERGDNEAKFAYALIMAHFNDKHNHRNRIEALIDETYKRDIAGGVYARAYSLYHGVGGRRDIEKAANILAIASQGKPATDTEDEELPWEQITTLWTTVASDPQFSLYKRYASLHKAGAANRKYFEAKLTSGEGKNPGLALQAKRMTKIINSAQSDLAVAFGIADEYAREKKDAEDVLRDADGQSQIIAKNVEVSKRTLNLVTDTINAAERDLGPKGQAVVDKAHQEAGFVANEVISNALPGALQSFTQYPDFLNSDFASFTKSLDSLKGTACRLYSALDEYKRRKNMNVLTGPIKEVDSDKF